MKADLEEKLAGAVAAEYDPGNAADLVKLLAKYVEVFQLTLGDDPPVDMPPLKIHLKSDAKPIRCKARRFSLPQRDFIQKHIQELQDAGFVYRNSSSCRAFAPLIVRNPLTKDKFRMTVDLRPVNQETERIAWSMPMLEVVVDYLSGATCFSFWTFSKATGSSVWM